MQGREEQPAAELTHWARERTAVELAFATALAKACRPADAPAAPLTRLELAIIIPQLYREEAYATE